MAGCKEKVRAMFEGKKLCIATRHQKQNAIAPVLEKHLGVQCFVPDSFDTDRFGTFSGEVRREDDPIATARKKCLAAANTYGCSLVLASEGSFGMHPAMPLVHANQEFIMLMDLQNQHEWLASALSTETNFAATEVKTIGELDEFASKAGFPEHALILRPDKDSLDCIFKGIKSTYELYENFGYLQLMHKKAYVETDMRAMHNPMRMKVIHEAATNLVNKLLQCCPNCGFPGFSVTEALEGLPCELCSMPTKTACEFIKTCSQCSYKETIPHPDKEKESSMYCDFCNP